MIVSMSSGRSSDIIYDSGGGELRSDKSSFQDEKGCTVSTTRICIEMMISDSEPENVQKKVSH